MDFVELSLDLRGSDAEAFFDFAGYKARDMREPLTRVSEMIQGQVALNFLTESDSGVPWAPLTPEYEAWKLNEVGPQPILQLHGFLFLEAIDPAAFHVTRDTMTYNVNVPNKRGEDYGHFHQEGTSKMVERPWLSWGPAQEDAVQSFFVTWLNELKDKNARRSHLPSIGSLADLGFQSADFIFGP